MPVSPNIIERFLASPQGKAALVVTETLQKAGEEAFVVGGAVRSLLLERLPDEVDMTTSALPGVVCSLFPKHNDYGADLGTVVVSTGGETIEVTTFREDVPGDNNRHPEAVRFCDKEHDAARRDFTVNALYWNAVTGELWDPFGGEKDMEERLVRFIGEAKKRIEEDALRVLRGVRLRASIAGQYHPETYAALRESSILTKSLSGSRVLTELERMLLTPQPARALEDLWELGVMKVVCPELHDCKGIAQPLDYHNEGDVWDHSLQCVASAVADNGPDVRLAALFHDCGKVHTFAQAERIRFDSHASVSADVCSQVLVRWQCPKARVQKIDWLVRHHMMLGDFFTMTEERKSHWYHHPWFSELLQLFWLDIAGTTPADFSLYDKLIADYNRFLDAHPRPVKPLLSGEKVMEILGITPGAKVGEVLSQLYAKQIEGSIRSKAEAEEFLKTLM